MGSRNLAQFVASVSDDYFTGCLLGAISSNEIDVSKTFAAVRRFIREEIGLLWYNHKDFQVGMREKLNQFQQACEENKNSDGRYFIDNFSNSFIDDLDYYDIKDKYDRENVQKEFRNMLDEPWHFIVTRKNAKYKWLCDLHKKLKQHIRNDN